MDSDLLPSVLDFSVEGGAHCATRWEDGALVFYPSGWWVASEPSVRVQPQADEWHSFRALLDDLGVWQWQGDFSAGVMGGTPWTLHIEWAGRSIYCSGNTWRANAAPKDFRRFVVGLAAIVGLPDTRLSSWAND